MKRSDGRHLYRYEGGRKERNAYDGVKLLAPADEPQINFSLKPMPPFSQLRLSNTQKIIGGVCGGLAGWLGWDVTLVRILFVVGSFIPVVPGFVVYLILWIVLPRE